MGLYYHDTKRLMAYIPKEWGKMGLVMRTYAYVPAKPGFSAGSATNLLALYLSILYVYATVLSRYEEVSRVDTDRVGKMGLILCTFILYPYRSILS